MPISFRRLTIATALSAAFAAMTPGVLMAQQDPAPQADPHLRKPSPLDDQETAEFEAHAQAAMKSAADRYADLQARHDKGQLTDDQFQAERQKLEAELFPAQALVDLPNDLHLRGCTTDGTAIDIPVQAGFDIHAVSALYNKNGADKTRAPSRVISGLLDTLDDGLEKMGADIINTGSAADFAGEAEHEALRKALSALAGDMVKKFEIGTALMTGQPTVKPASCGVALNNPQGTDPAPPSP